MKFTLIICTYQRPQAIVTLLNSVNEQLVYPDQIVIVDGSLNINTQEVFSNHDYKNLEYFLVDSSNRGLTKQRNYGIDKVDPTSEIVCFLDDDIVLTPTYFELLLDTYKSYPDALGVGGYIANEVNWRPVAKGYVPKINEYTFDGYARSDGSRFVIRKRLGLDADQPPAHMPNFAHGRSVSFLPPSGKIYPVQQFMGGVSSFKREALQEQKFSEYFEGYGLYEDADYTLRLSKKGPLYVNTAAQLYHYHDADGRPNQFYYGKMVVRNGWYVWRIAHPKPSIKGRIKWNLTSGLLTLIRFTNVLTTSKRKTAFTEALGRTIGWWSLLISRPKRQ